MGGMRDGFQLAILNSPIFNLYAVSSFFPRGEFSRYLSGSEHLESPTMISTNMENEQGWMMNDAVSGLMHTLWLRCTVSGIQHVWGQNVI